MNGATPATTRRLVTHDARARSLVGGMTLAEKVGQMTQAEEHQLSDGCDVETYALGSLMSGGESGCGANALADWTDTYDRHQARAFRTRLRIPLLYGVDAVHGHNKVVGAVIFPHNIGLGASRDPRLVEEIAAVTAKEVRATGIQWSFAPCVAVARDVRWGRTYESFSEDPAIVAQMGAAAVRGLQGSDLSEPLRVLACAKHYLADGGTVFGSGTVPADGVPGGRHPLDQGDARLTESELRRIHLPAYIRAIQAGVGSIMVSFSSWNGQRIAGHRYLLTDVLKYELGFEGFLVSDYNGIDGIPPDYRTAVRQSVNAGLDMCMVPGRYREFIAILTDLVQKGEVPMARIDDAVTRILRVKIALGLLDLARAPTADRRLHAEFGSPGHRAVARRAVRQSLVLLRNGDGALPLRRTARRIHVSGCCADDLGNQCGGWTITWQGKSGVLTRGTTVLAALRESAGGGTAVSYSPDGSGAEGADVAVVVVGETPYAEFKGDRADLSLGEGDRAAVARVKQAGVPTVLVLISGRPLVLGDTLTEADAVMAAWLPGTEGQGVADVLFGDHAPTGKLPFSWPRSGGQISSHSASANGQPVFTFGHGLTY